MKNFLIILLLMSSALTAQDLKKEGAISLQESLEIGLKQSREIRFSKSRLKQLGLKLQETGAQMLPRVSLGAGYSRLSSVPDFEINLPISPKPIKIQQAILNNYRFQLSLEEPIYSGGRLTALRAQAEYSQKSYDAESSRKMNEEALKIRTAFWNYYRAERVLLSVNENIKALSKHETDTKNLLSEGLLTRNDLLKIQVELSNLSLSRVDAENSVLLSRANFNQAIGLPQREATDIRTLPGDSASSAAEAYEDCLNEAMLNRPEIKSAGYNLMVAQEGKNAVFAALLPSINFAANLYYNRPNQRIMPAEDGFKGTWDAGVNLSWELFNFDANSYRISQAEESLNQTEISLRILKEGIEQEVYGNFLSLKSLTEKLKINKAALAQAEENFRITGEKYRAGTGSSSDLVDAEVSLMNAKVRIANSTAELETGKSRLYMSLGRKLY